MRLNSCLSRLSVGATVFAGAMAMAGMASAADKKYQFYLSFSYVGNGWQTRLRI